MPTVWATAGLGTPVPATARQGRTTIALIRDNDLAGWFKRLRFGITIVIYVGLVWTAARAALGISAYDASLIERVSKGLPGSLPGRFAVFVGGAVALIVAGFWTYQGYQRRFLPTWGSILVAPAGVGLIAYGVLCAVSLKHRDVRS